MSTERPSCCLLLATCYLLLATCYLLLGRGMRELFGRQTAIRRVRWRYRRSRMRIAAIAAVVIAGLISGAAAQQPPAFEVASIKEHPFVRGSRVGIEFRPGGRVTGNAPITMVITAAYNILPSQLEFAPGLLDNFRNFYDIDARADSGAIPPGRLTRQSL